MECIIVYVGCSYTEGLVNDFVIAEMPTYFQLCYRKEKFKKYGLHTPHKTGFWTDRYYIFLYM